MDWIYSKLHFRMLWSSVCSSVVCNSKWNHGAVEYRGFQRACFRRSRYKGPNCVSLKQKCHFDKIFITGCTESCQCDNSQCNQRLKFHQNYFIKIFSVQCLRASITFGDCYKGLYPNHILNTNRTNLVYLYRISQSPSRFEIVRMMRQCTFQND